MKVYVVTSGEYSDFGIEQIFSSLEKAYDYIKLVKEYGNRYINEEVDTYEVDPIIKPPDKKFKYIYFVQMDRDGNTHYISQESEDLIPDPDLGETPPHRDEYHFSTHTNYMDRKTYIVITAYINANDTDHAIKILNERRIKLLLCKGKDSFPTDENDPRITTHTVKTFEE